jgi:tripartite ATP-independent transporter DctM subunit
VSKVLDHMEAQAHSVDTEPPSAAATITSEQGLESTRTRFRRDGSLDRGWSGAVWFDRGLEGIVGAAILGELAVVLLNVVSRVTTGDSILWTQEVSQLALLTVAFVGGAIAYPKGAHMSVRALVDRLPARWRPHQEALVDWLVLAMGAASLVLFRPVLAERWNSRTPIMHVREFWLSMPMAVGMALICYFAIYRLALRSVRSVAGGLVGLLAIGGLALLLGAWAHESSTQSLLGIVLLALFALLFLGVPIAFVLALISGAYIYWGGFSDVSAVPIGMESGAKGFLLLAIPFFILAGAIMNSARLMAPLARVCETFIGHIRGGLLQVILPTMYIFSGISGSKVADVAAVGTSMRDMLDERKYPRGEVVAVLSASAIMGETIPPSLVLLVLGSITSLSTVALFAAGVLPAAFLAVCVMALIYFRARKLEVIASPKASWRTRGTSLVAAIPVLILPIGLVGGIVSGVATPTEVSGLAAAYGLLIVFAYRRASGRVFWEAFRDTSTSAGMILFIIAAASPFAQALAIGGASDQIATLMAGLGQSKILFFAVSILLLIVMGQILEGLPAILIFAPLLLPPALALGINPIQYCMVLIVAMGIGSFAPPAGIGFYVASAIGRETMEKSLRHFVPYLLALIVGIAVLAAIPWLSTALPNALGLG